MKKKNLYKKKLMEFYLGISSVLFFLTFYFENFIYYLFFIVIIQREVMKK